MKQLLVVLALAFVATAETAPLFIRQADKTLDPKEMAAVQRIRTRIEERAGKTVSESKAYTLTIPNTTVSYGMAPVPAGEYLMGSASGGNQASGTERGAGVPASGASRGSGGSAPETSGSAKGAIFPRIKIDEQPQHKVRLDAFWMQTHEVTWDAYLMFMFADQAGEREHPEALVDALSRPTAPFLEMSFGRGNSGYPAISMTQHAANKFAQWLSAKTGEYYRLPTEAEWEYACRAGSTTPIPPGRLDEYAWYAKNSAMAPFTGGTYHKVGTKKPNAWGLYDMLGNVMEWTLDQYAPYTAAPAENPRVRSTAPYPHAVRGGSWNDDEARLTCTARVPSDLSWKKLDPQLPKSIWYMTNAQWLGFRLVRPATLPRVEEMYRAWNNGVELDPY
jgi:formylglycine-generating enzyme required for sulfatase activity